MFFGPIIFKTLGFGANTSLMSSFIIGIVNIGATIVFIVCVDHFGCYALFRKGGLQILITQVAIGVILGMKFRVSGVETLSKADVDLVVIIVCVYVVAFAWLWGPLGWLVPSEIFPIETCMVG
ncbi:hypothetical protein Ancab_029140 [Ancistrocladus abbreviatus]